MSFHMVADHAIRPQESDIIFGLAGRAKKAAAVYGDKNIINSTIGALLDDEGKLITFQTVFDHFKGLDNSLIAAYASLEGEPVFLEAVIKACFMDHKPKGFIKAVATPGGTGAIRHAVYNFTDEGDTFITANWFWSPYETIAKEYDRKLDTFNLFDKDNRFDFESYKEKFEYYLNKQKRLVVILNTPAHNPTGYTISDEEWDRIIALALEHAKDKDKKIIFAVDVAYIDFSAKESRVFMEKFGGLPENILTLFAYSASKSYTMYGLRNGAILCVTSVEALAEEFFYSCAHSNRGTWSNGTRGAMQVIANIYSDPELYDVVEKERDQYRELLKRRGDAFLDAAAEAELPITNYCDGFFVSIPCKDPNALCEGLIEEKLFAVPLQNGLRLALCAISEEKCRQAPMIIKKVLQRIGG